MTEELLEKGKDLQSIIKTLKESIAKIDTMRPSVDTSRLTITIVQDPKVIGVIRKALTMCVDEKQKEFNNLNMDTRSHNKIENQKVINFEEEHRVPTGSDYDLDKVKVQQATTSSGISFGDICASMIELHDKKNADYGDAFTKSMDIFGSPYLVSRLHDKVQRLINFSLGAEVQVKDETVLDTLMDLACYAIMGIEYYQKR